ncbi:hypothetical protein Krac_0506 [Ktedonobacter racemifer DSM 44963]|uniref:Uncharacterized protein n=1 Tax=Ktedonobacter racemifer DSM 44963 TaxID=485913 RepID=D6U7W3_KTERA|nr:hypothetical protein Krac_0506 [Ktedonobacter racemifer DSM 44963]
MGSKLLAHQIIAHDVEVEGYPVRYRVIDQFGEPARSPISCFSPTQDAMALMRI